MHREGLKLVIASMVMTGCTVISLGGNMPQKVSADLAKQVAEKIKDLVENRDLLGWTTSDSAARLVVKMTGKASDDDKEARSLYEAGSLLARNFGNDRERKIALVREALTVLREQRDGTAKPSAPREVPSSDTLDWLSSVQTNAMAASGAR